MSNYDLGVTIASGLTVLATVPVFRDAFGKSHGCPELHIFGACCGLIAVGGTYVCLRSFGKYLNVWHC